MMKYGLNQLTCREVQARVTLDMSGVTCIEVEGFVFRFWQHLGIGSVGVKRSVRVDKELKEKRLTT